MLWRLWPYSPFNGLITRFGAIQIRVSPFWNPSAIEDIDPERLLALSLQNRIGTALIVAAVIALTFSRAERREKMLGA